VNEAVTRVTYIAHFSHICWICKIFALLQTQTRINSIALEKWTESQ